jgi:hypothetical protein
MAWSSRRQFLYAAGVFTFFALLLGFSWYAFIYEPPSCVDGVLNQDEEDIDCGGVCSDLCTAPRVSALWARSVRVAPGVYHAVAMVRNPESKAGTDALPYTFSLFDSDNILVAEVRGTMVLNPGDIVPLIFTNIETRERIPERTFVTFGVSDWERRERVVSPVRIVSQEFDESALRLTAIVENMTPYPQSGVILTALVYDTEEVLIAASQTSISTLPARGSKSIVFTWQEPFSKPVLRADITARVERPGE